MTTRRWFALACAATLAGCASQPAMPKNAVLGTLHAATPVMSAPGDPPVIEELAFNTLELGAKRPDELRASVRTSSNVASVELRTSLFSLNARKTGVGTFAVAAQLLDVPPIFIRPYALRVIARTTNGVEAEEDVPFRIR